MPARGIRAGTTWPSSMNWACSKNGDRPLINGLRTSVSAKGGKFVSLSVRGSGPFIPEILARSGDPALAVHLYEAPAGAKLDDEFAWRKANPGLASGLKSMVYMRTEARRVAVTVADQSSFRALDMNQAIDSSAALLVGLDDWLACEVTELPDRRGSAYVGYDAGGSVSMTAACCYWPETGRLETYAAFPDTPDLKARGEADGAGEIYQRAFEAGRLQLHPGRVTDAIRFLGGPHRCTDRRGRAGVRVRPPSEGRDRAGARRCRVHLAGALAWDRSQCDRGRVA